MSVTRPSLFRMIGSGRAALSAYRGLMLALFAVSLVVSGVFAWVVTRILATVFGDEPLFDLALTGDLYALFLLLRETPQIFAAIFWMGFAVIAVYGVISWYLIGGLNAALIAEPESRADIMRSFATGALASFSAYLRLALLAVVPYFIIGFAAAVGMGRAQDALGQAVTVMELVRALLPNLAPAMLLWLVTDTALDYARIAITEKASDENPLGAARALWQSFRMVVTDYRPLVHALLYVVLFAAVTAGYIALTMGRPMEGMGGALLIFGLRQLTALIRHAVKFVWSGGQVAYFLGRE